MGILETDRLKEIIDRKHACLTRLRDMGKAQLMMVAQGRLSELLDVLAAKQRFLLELQAIEGELDPFRSQDPDQRIWRTPAARQACAEKLADCQRLLDEILTQEKQSEQELIRRRDETAALLQGVHRASEAQHAYGVVQWDRANTLDLASER